MTIKEEVMIKKFEELGALPKGHFVLTSGLHSDSFVSKDLVSTDPKLLGDLTEEVYAEKETWLLRAEVVAAPATGAIAFGYDLAKKLGKKFVYAEANRARTEMRFQRGFASLLPNKRVLIVEDIITSGKTVRQMIGAVEKLGGIVVGVVLLWLRSDEQFPGYQVYPIVAKKLPTWAVEVCPLCRNGQAITVDYNKHGQEFLDQFGNDPSGWPANKKR